MPGFQLPGPNEFGEPLLAIFAEMSRATIAPELKARLADVCWSTQKKRDSTLIAPIIQAYLASAEAFFRPVTDEKDIDRCLRWDAATQRLKRVLQLATMTKHELLGKVKETYECVFKNFIVESHLERGKPLE